MTKLRRPPTIRDANLVAHRALLSDPRRATPLLASFAYHPPPPAGNFLSQQSVSELDARRSTYSSLLAWHIWTTGDSEQRGSSQGARWQLGLHGRRSRSQAALPSLRATLPTSRLPPMPLTYGASTALVGISDVRQPLDHETPSAHPSSCGSMVHVPVKLQLQTSIGMPITLSRPKLEVPVSYMKSASHRCQDLQHRDSLHPSAVIHSPDALKSLTHG
ncbi:hypothetical protein C8T65DRAFT_31564 [Cerioporus squamosus]|nr:hypothetical protein C8T65DRAFT_31564 [Cerioporus squamosus]